MSWSGLGGGNDVVLLRLRECVGVAVVLGCRCGGRGSTNQGGEEEERVDFHGDTRIVLTGVSVG